MEAWALVRAFHVLGVVLWIGGVSMVTLSVLPAARDAGTREDGFALFAAVERRFARQSRWTTALVGASGFYLVAALDLWHRFVEPAYWWMAAMVLVWAVFTLLLFILEPLVLHRWFERRARQDPTGTMSLIVRMHWFLLALSLATIAGAVAGSHGLLLF
ncbi:MAG: hypothetical protein ACXW2I_02630 [Burkholderiales bacterium]